MKYTHAIIYKGKYYRAGEEVPAAGKDKPTSAKNTAEDDKIAKNNAEAPKKRGGKSGA